ncbi:MAG: phosphatase PAP2 family protein [Candidatus Abyssobacteria bacterium SURF_5]|uniref:Phosphatase PAP2 family protein n=1 Tax=Abyssobacteria bacterium (strain SURF_5) TaxID=2093360 RepID=A0A3A4N1I2_ABYX5|nr:MAG: phosphatase PAP2 family protein [Candidatus Abyssubacteria bacterium SURF_5]
MLPHACHDSQTDAALQRSTIIRRRDSMPECSFRLDLIQFLFEHRTGAMTALLQLFSFLGEVEGYILVISLIHVAYDKKLAFRLSALVLLAMSLNHVLKTIIANPRPFIREGTYMEKWAVSTANAHELAPEYSTPSGHAMAGSCFYSYLYGSVNSRYVRTAAIATLILTGISRPYLGVHYIEDIVLGWILGVPIALFAIRFVGDIRGLWNRHTLQHQLLIVVAASALVWLGTRPLYASSALGQPLPFVSYLGFLAGIVLGYPLEAKWVRFDPRSGCIVSKTLRYALSVVLVIGTLLLLDTVFGLAASDSSILGNILRYVRYAMAALAGVLLAPFLFVRLGLAGTTPKIKE